ncbi:MAG: ATP-binding protein, partial [Candidatus Binatia bacterium]
ALARALAGEGQIVGITADAGVGKSRLCHEFIARCRGRGVRVVEAHALPHGKMIPFLPWIDQMRNEFGVSPEDGDETARDKIAGRALRLDPSLADALPVLFDFLGVPDPARPVPPMDPEARNRQLVDVTQRLLIARSGREPAVHLFEDLHWTDPGSEAFLAAMVGAVAATRTLLLLTFRPEYRASWTTGARYREISLSPLGPNAIADLLDELIGRDPSLAGLGERVLERARGNPFFVEEIVRSLIETGVLSGERRAYRLTRPIEKLEIPPSVHSILAARIDRLGGRQKHVLQTAAVIGKDFSQPILERVAAESPADLSELLHDLIAAELVQPTGLYPFAEFAFKHPLTQEVTYQSQLADRRGRTHGQVARAIAAVDGEKVDERAALLAHHFEAAGEKLEAARWSRRAARRIRASSLAGAFAHWKKVLELLDGAPESTETVTLALEARASVLQYGWILGISADEAAELFASSREVALRAGDRRTLAVLTATYAGIRSAHREIDEYLRLSRAAVALAEETGDAALRAAVWPSLVRSHLIAGRLREALVLSEQGLATIPADPGFGTLLGFSPYLNLLQLRANLLAYAGRWREAVDGFERMIAIAREQTHPVLVDSGSSDYGWWAALFGDPATALVQARRGVEVAEKLGNQMSRVYAYNALGVAELAGGRFAEAVAALERALSIAREMRTGQEAGILTLAHLAEAELGRGDRDRAHELGERAVDEASRHRVPTVECFARLVLARVLLSAAGAAETTAARTALDRALVLVEETGARCHEPFIRIERAKLAELTGDQKGREQENSLAERLLGEIGIRR